MLIPLNEKKRGDEHSLLSKRRVKVEVAFFKDMLLNIALYWPSLCFSGIGIGICKKDYIEKNKRDNSSLGTGIVDVKIDNLGTNIVDGDGKANNLSPSTSTVDGGIDDSSSSIGIVYIKGNNLGTYTVDRNEGADNPSSVPSIRDGDRRVDNPTLSIGIADRDKGVNNQATISNKACISFFALYKAFFKFFSSKL